MRHTRPLRSMERPDDPVRIEVISKPGGGSRTLAHLGERDRRRYDAVVAAVTPEVERALTAGVVANRARVTDERLELEPWTLARRRFVRSLSAATKGPSRAAFVGDVHDCYGSITPATVERALHMLGVAPGPIERLATLLRNFESRGVRGLPIGPYPSAVLANAVLAPVDDALSESASGPIFRWVDDVVVFAHGSSAARRTWHCFDRALGALGLSANDAKCHLVDDPIAVLAGAAKTCISSTSRRGMMRAL